jgi:hypothetical protein
MGDGKTSPFGNGKGGMGGGSMGKGNDFVTNPGGSGSSGQKPRDFVNASRPQSSGGDTTINTETIPEGGIRLQADPKGDDKGNPIGTTASSDGGTRKPPFKLNG